MAKTYIAQDKTSGVSIGGGLNACLQWANNRVSQCPKSVVIIIRARPNEDGKVIAEVDSNCGRWLFDGRYIKKRDISKMIRSISNG